MSSGKHSASSGRLDVQHGLAVLRIPRPPDPDLTAVLEPNRRVRFPTGETWTADDLRRLADTLDTLGTSDR